MKYEIHAIPSVSSNHEHFIVRTIDKGLIMRRETNHDITLFADDQETRINISATDARDLALWILCNQPFCPIHMLPKLCGSCYTTAQRLVFKGKTSWYELIAKGKAKPKKERKICDKNKWFLS